MKDPVVIKVLPYEIFAEKKSQRTVGRLGLGSRFSCTMIGYISNENRKISL